MSTIILSLMLPKLGQFESAHLYNLSQSLVILDVSFTLHTLSLTKNQIVPTEYRRLSKREEK